VKLNTAATATTRIGDRRGTADITNRESINPGRDRAASPTSPRRRIRPHGFVLVGQLTQADLQYRIGAVVRQALRARSLLSETLGF
jgi:hypothetical protein